MSETAALAATPARPPATGTPNLPVLLAAAAQALVTVALLATTRGAPHLALRLVVVVFLALGFCWGANTFSHIHLHSPLFRTSLGNRGFSLLLVLSLGMPQTWWKRRHLVHHGLSVPPAWPTECAAMAVEIGAIVVAWATAAHFVPNVFFMTYLPAWLLGLGFCAVQGHYEHAAAPEAAGVDYHGRVYNHLWFNDGYHAAHHRDPALHWRALRQVVPHEARRPASKALSAWPPLLRWMDPLGRRASHLASVMLDLLERLALRSRWLRRLLMVTHRRAMEALFRQAEPPPAGRVCIIGGGLFPRTALILRALRPDLVLVIVDGERVHLDRARALLGARGELIFVQGFHDARDRESPLAREVARCDLLVVPLAYRGDRAWLYQHPPTRLVIIHDWFWRKRGSDGVNVSPWLLKRMNLLRGGNPRDPSVTLDDESPWPHPLSASRPPSPPHSAGAIGKRS